MAGSWACCTRFEPNDGRRPSSRAWAGPCLPPSPWRRSSRRSPEHRGSAPLGPRRQRPDRAWAARSACASMPSPSPQTPLFSLPSHSHSHSHSQVTVMGARSFRSWVRHCLRVWVLPLGVPFGNSHWVRPLGLPFGTCALPPSGSCACSSPGWFGCASRLHRCGCRPSRRPGTRVRPPRNRQAARRRARRPPGHR